MTHFVTSLSVYIETFSKAKEETRADDSATHKQVGGGGENEYYPETLLSDIT